MVPLEPPEALKVAFSQSAPPPVTMTSPGAEFTVTEDGLWSLPTLFVTVTIPVVPEPAVTSIVVAELDVIVAAVPPIVTDVAPPNDVPDIVKVPPSQTVLGETEEIVGVAAIVKRVFGL
jgi:hypothetical protein